MNWRAGVDDEHYVYAMRIEDIDESVDYGEERTRTIGMTRGNVLSVVTKMHDRDLCRIISEEVVEECCCHRLRGWNRMKVVGVRKSTPPYALMSVFKCVRRVFPPSIAAFLPAMDAYGRRRECEASQRSAAASLASVYASELPLIPDPRLPVLTDNAKVANGTSQRINRRIVPREWPLLRKAGRAKQDLVAGCNHGLSCSPRLPGDLSSLSHGRNHFNGSSKTLCDVLRGLPTLLNFNRVLLSQFPVDIAHGQHNLSLCGRFDFFFRLIGLPPRFLMLHQIKQDLVPLVEVVRKHQCNPAVDGLKPVHDPFLTWRKFIVPHLD